jgi:hypothetical protein
MRKERRNGEEPIGFYQGVSFVGGGGGVGAESSEAKGC